MIFVHDDPEFELLLAIVADSAGISDALIEKDYWITHTLWALGETGLDLWLKGGTSLSKGFGLIERFSEDLDLVIRAGIVTDLPDVTSWTSTNKGPVAQRQDFYRALTHVLDLPAVRIERDHSRLDRRARGADYLVHYPGVRLNQLDPVMSPFVRLEVGHARVVPSVQTPISSFVHGHLDDQETLVEFHDNRPRSVTCVHPLVTLFEKLESMARHYTRDPISPEAFVRHYEDSASIIRAYGALPGLDTNPAEIARDLVMNHDLRVLPDPDEPSLLLADQGKREAILRAHDAIAPMFWGPRISLDEACRQIRAWLRKQGF